MVSTRKAQKNEADNLENKEHQSRLQNTKKKVQETEAASLVSYENQLKEKLKLAEEGYKNAYDSGDKDKLLEAQKAIADATTELRMVDAKRFYMDDQAKKTEPKQADSGANEASREAQPQPQQTPKLHKFARE